MKLGPKAEAIVVVLLGLAYFFWIQFQSPYISEPDGYYHIKFAHLLKTHGFIRDFSWSTLSLWTERFSDKEWLYHYLLVPFTFLNLQEGIKLSAVVFATFSFWSFYRILKLNGLPFVPFWLLCFFGASLLFLVRLSAPRPHVLAVGMSLWSMHFLMNRQYKRAAVLSFFYTHCYTGFILPLIFAALDTLAHILSSQRRETLKGFVWITGATFLAMLVNPYFPRNFEMFYVQNLYVLWMATFSGFRPNVGGEFYPVSTRDLLTDAPLLLMLVFASALILVYRPKDLGPKARSLFLYACALVGLALLSKRFMEYAVPALLLFAALVFSSHREGFEAWLRHLTAWRRWAFKGFVIAFTAFSTLHTESQLRRYFVAKKSRFKFASLELAAVTKSNEAIFSCDWDDTPELWYYNSDRRYLVFLDPNFMYYTHPEHYVLWRKIGEGALEAPELARTLKDTFGTRVGVCGGEYQAFRSKLDPKYFKILYEDPFVFVFQVSN